MAAISWKYNASGLWATSANWSSGTLPGAADDVTLATLSYHTITYSSISSTINSLNATTDSLSVTSGTLAILSTAHFDQGLSVTGGTLSFLGKTATVTGTFTGVSSEILLVAGTDLAVTGTTIFDTTSYGANGPQIDGPGTLSTSGTTSVLQNPDGYNTALVLGGGVTWAMSGLVLDSGIIYTGDGVGLTAVLVNAAGNSYDFTSNSAAIYNGSARGPQNQTLYGGSTFSNAGTLAKTAGTGTNYIDSLFTNTGIIDATGGTIEFDGGGTFGGTLTGAGQVAFGGGTVTVSAAANITIASLLVDGANTIFAAPISYAGTVTLTNGTINLAAGTNSFAAFSQYGTNYDHVVLGVSTSLSLTNADLGSGYTDGGILTTSGTTTLSGYANYAYYLGANAVLTNSGTVNDTYYLEIDNGSGAGYTINNQAGATWNITGDNYWMGGNGSGTEFSTFNNAGTFAKSGGTATNQIYSAFTNTGTINATSGTLEFDGGGTLGGTLAGAGTISFASNSGTLASNVSLQVATFYIDGGSVTLDGSESYTGSFVFSSGYLYLNNNNFNTANSLLSNGTLDGAGTLTVSGATQLGNNGFFFGGNVAISNTGTVYQNGYVYVSYQSGAGFSLTNASGATYEILNNYQIGGNNYNGTSSVINNAGLFEKTGGTGTANVYSVSNDTGTISSSAGNLEFDGGGSFAGKLTGTGSISFGGGAAIFAAGLTSNVATLDIDGGSVTLGENFANGSSAFTLTATLDLGGYTLAATNANLGAATINGPGTITTAGTTQLAGYNNQGYAAYLGGGLTLNNSNTLNQNYYVYVVNQSNITAYTINNKGGATWNITGDYQIGGNQASGEKSLFSNAGTFAKTGGTGTTVVSSYFTNTGTVSASVANTTIEFNGGGVFGGSITGTGAISFNNANFSWAGLIGATGTQETIYYSGIDVTASSKVGPLNTLSSSLTLATGTTLTVKGLLGIVQAGGGLPLDGAGTLVTIGGVNIVDWYYNGVMFSVGGDSTWQNTGTVTAGGILQIGDSQTQYGSAAGTVINTATGVYDMSTDDAAIFEGSYINGFGQTLSSGGLFDNAGLFEKTGGTATSHVYADVVSTGTIATTSGTIGFYGGGTFSGLIADGSNIVLGSGNYTINALAIGGGATVTNAATATLLSTLTLGDTSTSAASFDNSGLLDIGADVGVLKGGATAPGFVNTGTFAKTGGTGRSLVNVVVANSGTISVDTGTLALTGSVTGTGAMDIGAGATLELGTGVAATQGVSFTAATGTLLLDSVSAFVGTVSGLTVGDAFDLATSTATTASVNSVDQLIVFDGTKVVTRIDLTGSYLSDKFTVASDGKGGSLVTLTSAATAWKGTNADWFATNVWTNGLPTAQTNTAVSLSGAYTLSMAGNETAHANTLVLSAASATYALNGLLMISTSMTLTAGDLQLGGTIDGGTVSNKGGNFTFNGGTLENVVFNGPIDLSENNASLSVDGSFALAGAGGTGTTTIGLTGSNAYLNLLGDETLNDATVSIGNSSGGTAFLRAYDPNGQGAILTLGSALTLNQTGTDAVLADSANAFDAIFNDGKITASLAGGTFSVLGNEFENDNIITVSNGDTFNIASAQFVNTRTLSVDAATLGLSGSFQNTGSVTATNSVLNFATTLTGSLLNAIVAGGSDTLNLSGTLDLAGATLSVGPAAKITALNLSGNINGGTVDAASTGFTFLNGSSLDNVTYDGTMAVGSGVTVSLGGTISSAAIADSGNGIIFTPLTELDAVKYQGTLTLQPGNTVELLGGIGLSGPGGTGQGAIDAVGGTTASTLYVLDSETLSNVQMFSGTGTGGALGLVLDAAGTSKNTLTLATTSTLTVFIDTAAEFDSISPATGLALSDAVTNDGLITLQSGATLTIDSSIGTFTNAGSMTVATGAVANVGATFAESTAGTVAVSAGGLFNANGASSIAALAGVGGFGTLGINGTLQFAGGTFDMAASGRIANVEIGGTLQGGTFINDAGSVTFGSLATLSGMIWKGPLDIGAGSTLDVAGSLAVETLSGGLPGAIALAGGAGAGAGLAYLAAALDNLTVSASGSASYSSPSLADSIALDTAGTLTFGTHFTLDVTAGATTLADPAGSGAIVNDGAINVTGGEVWVGAGITSITNAGQMTFASDTAFDPEPGGGATTQFNTTGTVTLGSLVDFDVSGSGSNTGLLAVGAGSEVSFGGTFANTGTITLANGGSLTATGTMTNTGRITASGATTDYVTAASGAGSAFNAGTLTGGTWAVSSGSTLTLDFGGAVTTDAADISLGGANAVMRSVGSTIQRLESTLATIATGGTLQALGSRGYATTLALTDKGVIQIGGGTFTAAGLTVGTGAKVFGSGTVSNAISNSGTVQASGGTLTLNGAVSGTGVLITAGADLVLGAATAETVQFSGTNSELSLVARTSFTGTLSGIAATDSILLESTTATKAVLSGNTLTVSLSGGATQTFAVAGNSATVTLTIATSGGNSLLTYPSGPAVKGSPIGPAKASMSFLAPVVERVAHPPIAGEAIHSMEDFGGARNVLTNLFTPGGHVPDHAPLFGMAGMVSFDHASAIGVPHTAYLHAGRE